MIGIGGISSFIPRLLHQSNQLCPSCGEGIFAGRYRTIQGWRRTSERGRRFSGSYCKSCNKRKEKKKAKSALPSQVWWVSFKERQGSRKRTGKKQRMQRGRERAETRKTHIHDQVSCFRRDLRRNSKVDFGYSLVGGCAIRQRKGGPSLSTGAPVP